MKIDDPFNFSYYKKLCTAPGKFNDYQLLIDTTGNTTNIGTYNRQYHYKETEFHSFDQFLYSTWRDYPDEKRKESMPWGVKIP